MPKLRRNWLSRLYRYSPELFGEILAIIIFWILPLIGFILIYMKGR